VPLFKKIFVAVFIYGKAIENAMEQMPIFVVPIS
jgi:hypothetical protein